MNGCVDVIEVVGEAFEARLREVVELHPELGAVTEGEAKRLAREAVDAIVGPVLLQQLLSADRLDTTAAVRLLGISRQALHKKVRNGALLGVPGRGTTWFPGWQFDRDTGVRPVVALLLAAFGGDGNPPAEAVLSWSQTPQPELRAGGAGSGEWTPADWVAASRPGEPVLAAAPRAGRALAA